ncbi:insulinase family protein [Curvivirga sp.]|uniref:insulinase family protein n=1 Tax=Curvivirga sp. TaxID=2856848 RepID=UPI003B5A3A62
MFLKVILSFALCHIFGVLPTFAEILNHQIFYRQDKRAPLTSIEIVFLGAGRNQEQPSQIGLANTVSTLIWEAAKKQGYMDQLSALGTNLDIITHPLYQAISISALSENCGESIKIVFDFMHNLEFSDSDLQYAKKQEVADYQSGLQINTYTFMRTYALSQITGKKQFKSLKALKNFSLEDVRQYYDQLLKADVVFFKIISNRDSTEVAKLLHPITKERETGGLDLTRFGGYLISSQKGDPLCHQHVHLIQPS